MLLGCKRTNKYIILVNVTGHVTKEPVDWATVDSDLTINNHARYINTRKDKLKCKTL